MKNGKTPVNWLRSFEVAARHLSLSAAASELNVTPAAVSQQVRLLELRLGEKLFVRHARGLRLTLAGEALVPVCRESFERLDTALAELFGDRGKQLLVTRVSLGSRAAASHDLRKARPMQCRAARTTRGKRGRGLRPQA